MPKTISKKKKYNARFPPARIKKIMQTDEEVGKVAAAVPVIISRALEMFIESLISETAKLTQSKNAKTLSTSHIKQTIKNTHQFDFLNGLVKDVPDHQAEDNNGESTVNGDNSVKKGRGRPKKYIDSTDKRQKKDGNKSSSDEEEDEDEMSDEDYTDTEETTNRAVSHPIKNDSASSAKARDSTDPCCTQGIQTSNQVKDSEICSSQSQSEGGLMSQNNNRFPPFKTSSSITGKNLHQHPFGHPHPEGLVHLPNSKQQTLYQTPPAFNPLSCLPTFSPPKGPIVQQAPAHLSPAFPFHSAMQTSFQPQQLHQQQQQPMDLTKR